MASPKRKVTITIDADLVEEMERADEPVSVQVNRAVSESIAFRRQNRLLCEMLDGFDVDLGPVDPALLDKYRELMA